MVSNPGRGLTKHGKWAATRATKHLAIPPSRQSKSFGTGTRPDPPPAFPSAPRSESSSSPPRQPPLLAGDVLRMAWRKSSHPKWNPGNGVSWCCFGFEPSLRVLVATRRTPLVLTIAPKRRLGTRLRLYQSLEKVSVHHTRVRGVWQGADNPL